jgi:DNA-binding GntR family transcriptional regulator
MVRGRIVWQITSLPTHDEQLRLDVEPDQDVIRAARLRADDSGNFAYELVSVAACRLPLTDKTAELVEIRALATANKLILGQAVERLTHITADRIVAKHLQVAESQALLRCERIVSLQSGEAIEWLISFMRL